MKFSGKFEAAVETKRRYLVATFSVVQDAKSTGGCVLTSNTARELGVVTFNLNKITEQKSKTQKIKDKDLRDLIERFHSRDQILQQPTDLPCWCSTCTHNGGKTWEILNLSEYFLALNWFVFPSFTAFIAVQFVLLVHLASVYIY